MLTQPAPSLATSRPRSPVLFLFSLGFTAQIAQIVLFRELLTTFSGSEIVVAWLLGAWMLWTGAGSCLTHFLPRHLPNLTRWFYLLATLLIAAIMPLEIVAIRGLRAVCHMALGQSIPPSTLFLASLILLAPLGLALGAQFVLGARLVRSAEGVYVTECAGSAAAGVLTSCLLIPLLNSFALVFLTATLHLLAAAFLVARRPPDDGCHAFAAQFAEKACRLDHGHANRLGRSPASIFVLALSLIAILALFPFANTFDRASHELYWHLFNPQLQLVASRESPYGRIAVLYENQQYNIYQSGRLVFSLPDRGESAPPAQLAMAQHPNPKQILLIGAGVSGTLKEVLRHPITSVDYVEIDPALIDVARPYLAPADLQALSDPRVRIHHEDGRAFVRRTPDRFDLILIDAPDPTTAQSNRFYTSDFLTEAHRLLAPGGVICLGPVKNLEVSQSEDMLRRNGIIYATLRHTFRHVLATSGGVTYFLASDADNAPTLDVTVLARRLADRKIDLVDFTPYTDEFYVAKNNYELRTGRVQALTADPAAADAVLPLNTDARPVVYFQSILLWVHDLGDTALLDPLKKLQSASLAWLTAPLALILLITLFPTLRRARSGGMPSGAGAGGGSLGMLASWPSHNRIIAYAVLASGLSGMALEVLTILAFQNAAGAIYQRVGIMFALFMLGLALGAQTARLTANPHKSLSRLLLLQLAFSLLMISTPTLLSAPATLGIPALEQATFAAINLLSGILVGFIYPLAVQAVDNRSPTPPSSQETPSPRIPIRGPASAAALLYAADLLGGAIGSLLVSAALLPLFGVSTVSQVCAAANLLAVLLLLLLLLRHRPSPSEILNS